MNDKTLADRIVALGVYTRFTLQDTDTPYHIANAIPLSAKEFVRDWRVAGALMEKCADVRAIKYVDIEGDELVVADWGVEAIKGNGITSDDVYNESLPRAICEACVEALETNDE